MNISNHSQNSVTSLLREHISLFSSFERIYLFGSVLVSDIANNDIDILLIYIDYSDKLLDALTSISDCLDKKTGKQIDLTVLSEREEKETNFLAKLKGQYLQIK